MNKEFVCVTRTQLNWYIILFVLIVGFILFVFYKKREELTNINLTNHLSNEELQYKVKELQNKLYNSEINNQQCETNLAQTKQALVNNSSGQARLNKIYNPLISPERIYTNGRLSANDEYQMVGFIYKNDERYPLFGRYKYPGRSDRWEYYIMDETRNRLKIPFKSRGDNELQNNDTIDINGLGLGYNVNIYDYEQFRYNPNL